MGWMTIVSIDGIPKLWVKWIWDYGLNEFYNNWLDGFQNHGLNEFYSNGFSIWDSKTMGWMTIVSVDGILKLWVKWIL